MLELIILALEKGIPAGITLYNEIADSIAASKVVGADEKVSLLLRLTKISLPERHFVAPAAPESAS
jgi:hypothetical protein